ncbi:hippocampus abundant transcript 1 protein [Pyrus ussuriensis x Pyrus communis]|uniref:Hippocampus abundant transcript 1 protein n=1 Tax=Pyrus ussuriensis x Pyrus communis TaxID=2448454 RepID=A0A5N5IAZ2_9ROSA|nr:hippocampus abundant transcript 1 protein [Pyrus ussuriensis x Pyrus communis]KAB2636309.1 hippocampus abundant transcript 1 protein [Pyrus ussuriensis x Pyrus communis]
MEGIRGLWHLFVTVFFHGFASFVVLPAITDITMLALCPGRDECSLAIYLSGFQQAIIGVGTVVMTPVIGNLSDVYGRKSLLTIPLTLSIIPLVIMACSRETSFFYAFYVLRTVTALVGETSINCLALAYVADNVSERERISAFAILAGITSAAIVCGTLAARFLSTASIFQVAAFASILSTVYMRIFLKESLPGGDSSLRQPILKGGVSEVADEGDVYSPKTIQVFKKIPSPGELISLLRSSKILSQATVVSFFQSLADGGMQASLLYFLKARFHFNKNQFADLMLIFSISGATSQLLFMPMFATAIGEEKLLTIGLIMGSMSMFLNSISWAVWVPYAATLFNVFGYLVQPSIRSIASKQVGPHDQGRAQGCILGISSFANIVSPLLFSPLTALFLSEEAPFNFPGFSIMCIGLAPLIGFVQSLMIKASPKQTITNVCVESP